MASSEEYLDFFISIIVRVEEKTYRSMMGEYIVYYCRKIVGGIYDDNIYAKCKVQLTIWWSKGNAIGR